MLANSGWSATVGGTVAEATGANSGWRWISAASYNLVSLAGPATNVCDSDPMNNPANRATDPAEVRAALRRRLRRARKHVTGNQRTAAEQAINARILSLRLAHRATRVALFLADDGEPDLAPARHGLAATGVPLALPGLQPADRVAAGSPADVMDFRPWAPGEELHEGRFGIVEPATDVRLAPADLGLVLTPLVGFDAAGNRIGRGAGYYDRTFGPGRDHPERPVLLGVAFEVQRVASLPCESHDVPLDGVVTELGIRWCVKRPPPVVPHPQG